MPPCPAAASTRWTPVTAFVRAAVPAAQSNAWRRHGSDVNVGRGPVRARDGEDRDAGAENDRTADHRRRRQADSDDGATGQAEPRQRPRPAPLRRRQGERRGVGDCVVEEHGEGAEPDRPATSATRPTAMTAAATVNSARWGTRRVGCTASSKRGRSRFAGHREAGAADAREQRQQHAERRDRSADAYDRRLPRRASLLRRRRSMGRRWRRACRARPQPAR